MSDTVDLDQFYTAKEAAEVLSRNSGKTIDPSYVRTLAKYGKLTPKKISNRLCLYPRSQVDSYVVEERGEKSGRARQAKTTEEK
jgi:hypothetical protein